MSYEPHVCVFHADCADGGAAAWAIQRRWPAVTLMPGKYEEELDFGEVEVEGKNILFVDFSKPAELLLALINEGKANSVIVLDHHKSAQAGLAGLTQVPIDMAGNNWLDGMHAGAVLVHFDMEKSGARLAWEFAHPGAELPMILQFIEDRDLWLFKHGDKTRHFAASLRTHDLEDTATYDFANVNWRDMLTEGERILPIERRLIDKFLKEQYRLDMTAAYHQAFGTEGSPYHAGEGRPLEIPTVNVPYHFASDACAELIDQHPTAPFVSAWTRLANGQVKVSLRGKANTAIDVSKIAEQYGGGGHRYAAGFHMDASTF